MHSLALQTNVSFSKGFVHAEILKSVCYVNSDVVNLSAVASRLTRNVGVVGSTPIKVPRCFLEQETVPLLLSTGWFQERIRA